MNPQTLFCPNMDCPARGHKGKGNIQVHSQKDQRCVCQVCGQTFTVTKGTIFYRLRHAPRNGDQVLILLAYGCPIQAIVRAFGLDERTVRDWHARAGNHCQQVHEHLVENTVHDLKQAQADEIKVKTQKGTFWMALAIWVQPRLWMGGVVSPTRDLNLIQALGGQNQGHGFVSSTLAGGRRIVQLCRRLSDCLSEQVSSLGGRKGTMQDGGLARDCHCASRQTAYGRRPGC